MFPIQQDFLFTFIRGWRINDAECVTSYMIHRKDQQESRAREYVV